jgi:hypothetical protein
LKRSFHNVLVTEHYYKRNEVTQPQALRRPAPITTSQNLKLCNRTPVRMREVLRKEPVLRFPPPLAFAKLRGGLVCPPAQRSLRFREFGPIFIDVGASGSTPDLRTASQAHRCKLARGQIA